MSLSTSRDRETMYHWDGRWSAVFHSIRSVRIRGEKVVYSSYFWFSVPYKVITMLQCSFPDGHLKWKGMAELIFAKKLIMISSWNRFINTFLRVFWEGLEGFGLMWFQYKAFHYTWHKRKVRNKISHSCWRNRNASSSALRFSVAQLLENLFKGKVGICSQFCLYGNEHTSPAPQAVHWTHA